LLLIDEKAEIKEGSKWVYDKDSPSITPILGNTNIVKDGIKKGWFVKIIAYRPQTEEAKELDLPLLPPFENNIESIIKDCFGTNDNSKILLHELTHDDLRTLAKNGYEYGKRQSKQFSLEDVEKAIEMVREEHGWSDNSMEYTYYKEEIIQQIRQSRLPKGFEPEFIVLK